MYIFTFFLSLLDLSNASFSNLDHSRNESLTVATPTSIKPLNISLPKSIAKNYCSEDSRYFIGKVFIAYIKISTIYIIHNKVILLKSRMIY